MWVHSALRPQFGSNLVFGIQGIASRDISFVPLNPQRKFSPPSTAVQLRAALVNSARFELLTGICSRLYLTIRALGKDGKAHLANLITYTSTFVDDQIAYDRPNYSERLALRR
jgi:hypothetical protein